MMTTWIFLGAFNSRVPEAFYRQFGGLQLWQWLAIPTCLVAAAFVALLAQWLVLQFFGRLAKLTLFSWDDALLLRAKGPTFLLFFGILIASGIRSLRLPKSVLTLFDTFSHSIGIVAGAWFLLRLLAVGAETVQRTMAGAEGAWDPGRARGIQTQVAVLRRIAELLVWFVAAALLLTQFRVVRTVGVSLLASAGLAGLVLGLAAQKSIGSILAGIQLSLTQPIRIGDQIQLENEVGNVEEIGLTYVVVKLWDLRRMVVPITYFFDRSFQNWSKGVDQMLGTVVLQVDYTADIGAFRDAVARFLESKGRPLWDGKLGLVQVTDTSDRTQTLRVLVSTSNAGAGFDLRCALREHLIDFLQKHPQWMPRTRSENRTVTVQVQEDESGDTDVETDRPVSPK